MKSKQLLLLINTLSILQYASSLSPMFDDKRTFETIRETERIPYTSRLKRTPLGQFYGQTQSQYLSFDNSKRTGESDAQVTREGSRAFVTGAGMGQAQSQFFSKNCDCQGCVCGNLGKSFPGEDSVSNKHQLTFGTPLDKYASQHPQVGGPSALPADLTKYPLGTQIQKFPDNQTINGQVFVPGTYPPQKHGSTIYGDQQQPKQGVHPSTYFPPKHISESPGNQQQPNLVTPSTTYRNDKKGPTFSGSQKPPDYHTYYGSYPEGTHTSNIPGEQRLVQPGTIPATPIPDSSVHPPKADQGQGKGVQFGYPRLYPGDKYVPIPSQDKHYPESPTNSRMHPTETKIPGSSPVQPQLPTGMIPGTYSPVPDFGGGRRQPEKVTYHPGAPEHQQQQPVTNLNEAQYTELPGSQPGYSTYPDSRKTGIQDEIICHTQKFEDIRLEKTDNRCGTLTVLIGTGGPTQRVTNNDLDLIARNYKQNSSGPISYGSPPAEVTVLIGTGGPTQTVYKSGTGGPVPADTGHQIQEEVSTPFHHNLPNTLTPTSDLKDSRYNYENRPMGQPLHVYNGNTPDQYQPVVSQTRPNQYQPVVSQTSPNEYQPAVSQTSPNQYQPVVSQTSPNQYQPVVSQTSPNQYQPVVSQTRPSQYQPVVSQTSPNEYQPAVSQTYPSGPSKFKFDGTGSIESRDAKFGFSGYGTVWPGTQIYTSDNRPSPELYRPEIFQTREPIQESQQAIIPKYGVYDQHNTLQQGIYPTNDMYKLPQEGNYKVVSNNRPYSSAPGRIAETQTYDPNRMDHQISTLPKTVTYYPSSGYNSRPTQESSYFDPTRTGHKTFQPSETTSFEPGGGGHQHIQQGRFPSEVPAQGLQPENQFLGGASLKPIQTERQGQLPSTISTYRPVHTDQMGPDAIATVPSAACNAGCQPIQKTLNDSFSQAESSIKDGKAAASAQGKQGSGTAQAQVSGTYSGNGSFSASAQTSDVDRSAQSQVTGNSDGTLSQSGSLAGSGTSQSQVQVNSKTGDTAAQSQSGGINHQSKSEVQANAEGGLADAQSSGPGQTSSQAQIGFKPQNPRLDSQQSAFLGGGQASAQSSAHSGKSQSQIHGKSKYGILYHGAAQSASGPKEHLDTFKSQNLFNMTDQFGDFQGVLPENAHSSNITQSHVGGFAQSHQNGFKVRTSEYDNAANNKNNDKPLDFVEYDEEDDMYVTDDDYSNETENVDTKSSLIDHYIKNDTSSNVNSSSIDGKQNFFKNLFTNKNQEFGNSSYGPMSKHEISNHTLSKSKLTTETVPDVFRKKSNHQFTRFLPSKHSQVQNKSVEIPDSYISITKSITGSIDNSKNKTREVQNFSSTYYTKSSTCGYFTFSCNIVYGTNGRSKICRPKSTSNGKC